MKPSVIGRNPRLFLPLACCLIVSGCGSPYDFGLTEYPQDWNPAWSPDGQWLAFQHRGTDRIQGLYVARVDGTERRLLVPSGHTPAWSPDGSALVFGIGFSYQIFRLDLLSDSIVQLTTEGFNVGPAWSPDGRTIAFDSDGNQGYPTNLWLMDADGGNPRRVPLGTPESHAMADVDWAPSGDRLVAAAHWRVTESKSVHRLFITDTLGEDTSWVTAATVEVRHPAWSPTG